MPDESRRPKCNALDPKDREKTGKRKESKRQERRVAEKLGGKVQPGSGSDLRAKGDVELGEGSFLLEAKRSKYASLRIEAGWLTKISAEAFASGRKPGLAIELDVGNDPLTEKDWVLIPASVFRDMLAQHEG